MAFNRPVAARSLCPPERNTIPGTAAGTARRRQRIVTSATSSTAACCRQSWPGSSMPVLSNIASNTTRWSKRAANTVFNVALVTASQRAMVWLPSIKTSGSTIGTRPASWLNAANSASARALASRQVAVGRPSPMTITARHLVKRAPSSRYAASLSRSPSSPWVVFSPAKAGNAIVPWSTLIPGMTPCRARISGMGAPPPVFWRIVSSNRIAPLMNSPKAGAVNNNSR